MDLVGTIDQHMVIGDLTVVQLMVGVLTVDLGPQVIIHHLSLETPVLQHPVVLDQQRLFLIIEVLQALLEVVHRHFDQVVLLLEAAVEGDNFFVVLT